LSSDAALADGKVIANFGTDLIAFDQGTGEIIWQADGNGGPESSPAVASGTVVVGGATLKCYYAYPHDVALTALDIPFPVDPGETIDVMVQVSNEGLNDEADVQVQFRIDSTTVDTQTIALLPSQTSRAIVFQWTAPPAETICDVEVMVQIAAVEGDDDNNLMEHQVAVGGKTLHVPSDFATIQEALDTTDPGDTVLVADGSYEGEILIENSHMKLIAETPGGAVIDARDSIIVNGDFCELNGLLLNIGPRYYSDAGVVINSSHNRIYNCTISNSGNGILLGAGATNNVIEDCTLSLNTISGIRMSRGSENNLVQNCTFAENGSSDSYRSPAIDIAGNGNRVEHCDISSNYDDGVSLAGATNCQLIDLNVQSNGDTGIRLVHSITDSTGNLVQGCDVEGNNKGLSIIEAPDNIFKDNRLANNTYHIRFGRNAFIQDMDATNLIEGKPIFYLVSIQGFNYL
jgi:parallel beta-helix repeat protein